MRNLTTTELKAVSGGASKNAGGGPGNSGPGDKNSQNERGHGGVPPSWAK
jgi:bacteriocin-like protein